MPKALYSGSFDPVTYGHLDIIKRAHKVFDDLTVVVGNNPTKKYVFGIGERVQFIKHALRQTSVKVCSIQNRLIADFAYEEGIPTIIKGIRSIQDYDYERMMHEVNITQQRGIDTHFILARRDLAHISSSAVKELCRYQGFIHEYVTPWVKEALEQRMNDQIIVGLTGGIASGKSYVAERIVKDGVSLGFQVHNVDLDVVAHEIMESLTETAYRDLRNDIAREFGPQCVDNRKELGNIVFSSTESLNRLNKMMRNPILTRMRSIMSNMKGIILLNTALLVEADMLSMCNNNVIVVTASPLLQRERLRKRGLNDTQISSRLANQMSSSQRIGDVGRQITESGWGRLEIIDCNEPFPVWNAEKFWSVFKKITDSEHFYGGQ
jgi:pantetheine-phosphate adenylyltransferase